MSELKVSRGSVSFKSDERLTMEQVSNLAAAGQLIGIPADAKINHMSFQFGFGMNGEGSVIDISWSVE